jgi:hypothetical protein
MAKTSRLGSSPNGERAAVAAVLMNATRGILHAGDQLLVSRHDET